MGVVYRAVQTGLERVVALKVIAPELLDDEDVRRRFLAEARAAASVDHPHVIPVYDAGEHDGVAYIAMRYVDGDDLRTLVRHGGALDPAEAAELIGQAGAALDAIHRAGYVHRDVKPANLLVDPERHVYLTDFGLAKDVLTRTGGTQHRAVGRDARLRRARADPRRADRRARGRVRARRRAALRADRQGAVRARGRRGQAVGAAVGAAAGAVGGAARPAPGVRRRGGARDGQGAGRALPVGRGPRPRRARRRARAHADRARADGRPRRRRGPTPRRPSPGSPPRPRRAPRCPRRRRSGRPPASRCWPAGCWPRSRSPSRWSWRCATSRRRAPRSTRRRRDAAPPPTPSPTASATATATRDRDRHVRARRQDDQGRRRPPGGHRARRAATSGSSSAAPAVPDPRLARDGRRSASSIRRSAPTSRRSSPTATTCGSRSGRVARSSRSTARTGQELEAFPVPGDAAAARGRSHTASGWRPRSPPGEPGTAAAASTARPGACCSAMHRPRGRRRPAGGGRRGLGTSSATPASWRACDPGDATGRPTGRPRRAPARARCATATARSSWSTEDEDTVVRVDVDGRRRSPAPPATARRRRSYAGG